MANLSRLSDDELRALSAKSKTNSLAGMSDDDLRALSASAAPQQPVAAIPTSATAPNVPIAGMGTNGVDLPYYDPRYKEATQQREVREPPSMLRGVTDAVTRGFTGGLSDQARAVGGAVGTQLGDLVKGQDDPSFKQSYNQEITNIRDDEAAFARKNPYVGGTAEVAASMANPVLRAAGQYIGKGKGLFSQTGRAATTSAASGGIYGASTARESEQGMGAILGTASGLVLGGGSVPLIAGAVKLGQGFINQIVSRLPRATQGVAARQIVQALERDGFTPDQAVSRLKELGPDSALLDLGPNIRTLAAAAQQTPGKGKTAITKFLTDRQEGTRGPYKVKEGGQINRIDDEINRIVPERFGQTKQGIEDARRALGSEYNAARDGNDLVDVAPMLKDLTDEIDISKGGIKKYLQTVKDLLTDKEGRPEITIGTLHQVKMALDDLMSGEARMSMGAVSKSRVKHYEKQLVDAIEGSGPSGAAYNRGRLGTSSEWRKNDAIDSGVKFMRGSEFRDPEALKTALKEMAPDELHAFRVGAAQALKETIGGKTTVRQDVVKKLMDMPDMEKRIYSAFGDPKLFQRYITFLEGEGQMFKAYAKMGGSQTATNLQGIADAAIDPSRIAQGISQFTSGNPTDMVRGTMNILGGGKDRALMPAKMSDALGKTLTGKSVDPLRETARSYSGNQKMLRALQGLVPSRGTNILTEKMQKKLGVR